MYKYTPAKRLVIVALLIVGLFTVMAMDGEDQRRQAEYQARMVCEGHWPGDCPDWYAVVDNS